MVGTPKIVTPILILIILIAAIPRTGKAEVGTLVHKVELSDTLKPNPLLSQRTDYEDPDKFYRTYFGKSDEQVKSIYASRWSFHDKQTESTTNAWKDQHLNATALGAAPSESQMRKEFASQVLRLRLDSGIRAALYEVKNPALTKSYAKLKNTMDQVNNYPLKLSNKKDSKAGELRLGYDVLSDGSKIEYVQGLVETGIYHPKLAGLLMHQQSWDAANVKMSTNFGGTAPKASLSVPLHRNTVEGSLSKSLSETVSATLTTGQPWKDQTSAHTYNATVAYSF